MLNGIMSAVVWILGMPRMSGVTEGDNSVGRFFAVIFWPLALTGVIISIIFDEFKYWMRQRRKRKSQ